MTIATELPLEACPAKITRVHYELRCIVNGRATQSRDCHGTLREARVAAERLCRASGAETFCELETHENFADVKQDGIYLTTVRVEINSRPL